MRAGRCGAEMNVQVCPERRPAKSLDLILTILGQAQQNGERLVSGASQRALAARIDAFIQHRLDDAELSPEMIAAAHYISVRSLHRLFHAGERTVAGWIRAQRLGQCRRDLTDPRLAALPVHAIAARWGLTRPAHFSRIFKAAYGLSPSEYRQQAQQAAAVPAPGPEARPASPDAAGSPLSGGP